MPTLDWIGKQAVVRHHAEVPFHLLKEEPELSCGGEAGAGNLIVQGDNLKALKALLPHYGGQVKCIYIDPPYNTGNEGWVYNDNVNSPEINRWMESVVGKEGEDQTRHDKWLCMMYPRLVLLKKFLSQDGSIWISIDDFEIHHLRSLMDEIFGRDKFIACNVWQKRYSRENREAIGDVHEYLLVYAMNPENFKRTRHKVPLDEKQSKVYRNPNNDPKGRWRTIPITAQAGHATAEQFYEIKTPSGKVFKPSEGRCWGLAKATFEKLRNEGRIYFGKKGDSQPNLIRYLSEVEGLVPWTWWPHEDVGHTDEASKEMLGLFKGRAVFDTPKPSRLIQRILQIATDKDSLILDSFAGSGTTGHAVLKQNAEDGGKRRSILVEMDENIAQNITAERVRRVSQGYENAKGERVPGLGSGFRFSKLGKTLFDEAGAIREDVKFRELAEFVYFHHTGSPMPKGWKTSPLLGVVDGRAIYLLYNGILADRSVDGGNVLTAPILAALPPHTGPKTIYATSCRIGPNRLMKEGIQFKQTPYALRVD
jgi:adenine-specific DNA-methyltransferase